MLLRALRLPTRSNGRVSQGSWVPAPSEIPRFRRGSSLHCIDDINEELETAREAARAGNHGRARVCARRAAGLAIGAYLKKHSTVDPGPDALRQLTYVRDGAEFPDEIRSAAHRLTTRVTDTFDYAFDTNPISDAMMLIEYFLDRNDEARA
jgi:hypothetical protein